MESWKIVFHQGLVPLLDEEQLLRLKRALETDDQRLTQGSTTTPPLLMCVQDWVCEAACLLGFCEWHSPGEQTVGEIEEGFARLCFEIDQRLGEPAACRWLLKWFDDTPRDEMRKQLITEINGVLSEHTALTTTG